MLTVRIKDRIGIMRFTAITVLLVFVNAAGQLTLQFAPRFASRFTPKFAVLDSYFGGRVDQRVTVCPASDSHTVAQCRSEKEQTMAKTHGHSHAPRRFSFNLCKALSLSLSLSLSLCQDSLPKKEEKSSNFALLSRRASRRAR